MLVRAAVAGIELYRLLIVPLCVVELPQAPIGVAEVILNIGIARVAEPSRCECRNGAVPVAGDDRSFAGGKIRIERRPIRGLYHHGHRRADRPRLDRDRGPISPGWGLSRRRSQ